MQSRRTSLVSTPFTFHLALFQSATSGLVGLMQSILWFYCILMEWFHILFCTLFCLVKDESVLFSFQDLCYNMLIANDAAWLLKNQQYVKNKSELIYSTLQYSLGERKGAVWSCRVHVTCHLIHVWGDSKIERSTRDMLHVQWRRRYTCLVREVCEARSLSSSPHSWPWALQSDPKKWDQNNKD